MFTYIKQNLNISYKKNFNSSVEKNFAMGNWNLYRFRKETSNYSLRDFTKAPSAKKWMEDQINKQKSKLDTEKTSSLVKAQDMSKFRKISPYFKPDKRQFNKYIRHQAIQKTHLNESKDFDHLAMRLFTQDHTAQVLENLRKLKENKIFNRKMHEVRDKKLALKIESRKPENLIDNFKLKFLNYQNFNDKHFEAEKSYNLLNFTPEGRRLYDTNINQPNLLNDKIKHSQIGTESSKFVEYTNNKNQLSNLRIESLLSDKKTNERLRKYLIEDSSNVSGLISNSEESLGQMNDPQKMKESDTPSSSFLSQTLNKTSYDITKENKKLSNSLKNFFQPQIELTSKIQQYEVEIYNEYKQLDLYNKYNKGIVKFGDLTLQENLNYIKFNITNSRDLFRLYKEITHPDFTKFKKENETLQPVICSAILQKFAMGVKEEDQALTLFTDRDYIDLLARIKNNVEHISDKNLVDNLWSLGKLHKRNRSCCPKLFQNVLKEVIYEISNHRVSYLSFEQLSFLTEALDFLKINSKYDDEKVCQGEQDLIGKVYDQIIRICDKEVNHQFDPFNMAKILNYFYNINLEIGKFHKLLDSVGLHLKNFINNNMVAVIDLIDKKDLVKLVKAYSWGVVKNGISGRKNEIYLRSESVGDEESKIMIKGGEISENSMLIPVELKSSHGIQFYKEVLDNLISPILVKMKQLEIQHCSSFIYHYSNANMNNRHLLRELNQQIVEKLEKVEDFKLGDVLNFVYGMSKFYTKETFPHFHLDVFNVIYPNLNEKSSSHKFLILNKFKYNLFEKKDTLHIQNLSLIVYASSLMGYSDIDFFLPIYHNIIVTDKEFVNNRNNNKLPPMSFGDLGYLLQSLSLLNYNDEYILKYFVSKYVFLIKRALQKSKEYQQGLNMKINHFSLSQILSAIVNLSARKFYKESPGWVETLEKVKDYVLANFDSSDLHNSISVLWFFTYFENFDSELFEKLHMIIHENRSKLRRFESIVLNQIIVSNYIKHKYIYKSFTKEQVEEFNTLAKNFDQERSSIQKKIEVKDKYQENAFSDKVVNLLKDNKKTLEQEGYGFIENFIVANSYVVPVYFPKTNMCILFYDHTERLKSKNLNGYNIIKEDVLLSLGYKIERIYSDECQEANTEDKLFDLIISKIK